MPLGKLRFLYTGIRVRDLDRSLRFYRGLGFRVRIRGKMAHGGEFVHLVLGRNPHRLELNFYPKGNPFYGPFRPGTELDHFGFYVEDVAAWVRRCRKLGATIAAELTETRDRLVYVRDPDGIWLEFFGPLKAPRKARRGG